MDMQERKIAAFARMAQLVVRKHVREQALSSYDYLGGMINNMQQINTTLMTAAIKIIKKVREEKDVNIEALTNEFRNIIHSSVEQYTQRA